MLSGEDNRACSTADTSIPRPPAPLGRASGDHVSSTRPSAVIIDDAAFIRQAFAALMPKLNVLGGFSSADDFTESGARADVVVLELQRVDKSPGEVRRGLADLHRIAGAGNRVCVFSQEPRSYIHAACLAMGASGVVSKGDALPIAERWFVEVARGHVVVPDELVAAFDLLPRRRQLTLLTAQQRAVLRARARRWTLIETAERLEIAVTSAFAEWRAVGAAVHRYLQAAPLGDVTGELGLSPGDMADIWPVCTQDRVQNRS